jgi:type I restriction enzyme S subunit
VSAVLTAQEPSAKYLVNLQPPLVRHFDLIAQAPGGVARLRELILTLAVQGKLVPQDSSDEPASELLQKIRAEKDRLIAEGKIKRDKPLAEIADEEKPFELPQGWEWVRLGTLLDRISNGYSGGQSKSPTNFPLTRIETISKSTVDFARVGYCTDIQEPDIQKYKLEVGDILLSHINSDLHLGKTALYKEDRILIHGTNLLLLRSSAHVDPGFINLLINQLRLTGFFLTIAQHAIGQASINQSKITSILGALPPLAEQSRIVTRVEELMQLCDALEASDQLEAQQHAQLVSTLLGTLSQSETPEALADNWQRIATHFDLLLDRPEAVDALEQTILQLAVRGLLVPQDPTDEPASVLLHKIRTEKDHLIAQGKIKRDKPLPPITDEEKPFELPQGWEWARLQQAYDVRDGTHDTPKYQATGYPLVTSKNIYGGVLDLSDVKLISAEDHAQISARSKVDRNDILFAMIGSIGNPVLVDTDLEFSVKNVALFKYYAAPLSCPAYLLLLLQTEVKGIRERAAGAVQSFVSLGQLRSAVVALPPLAEQLRIVTRVNELRSLCADLHAHLQSEQSIQVQLASALIQAQ